MHHFKLGKKPARVGAVKLLAADYIDLSKLPARPASFNHVGLVQNPWGMLGNDQYGDCYWAGSCHEHMLSRATAGKQIQFTTAGCLMAYSAATGFNVNDSNSDQGTDMQEGAKFRQDHGIQDSDGNTHKIGAYLALEPGNWEEFLTMSWLFTEVGIGLALPSSAEDQFNRNQAWDVVEGATIEGGHYVSLTAALDDATATISTWGRGNQKMTKAFFTQYNDEGLVYLTTDALNGMGKTLDGFDLAQLQADLLVIRG